MVTSRPLTDEKCCGMKSIGGYCPRPLEMFSPFLTKRWSISVLVTLGNFRRLRFGELRSRLESVTSKVLSERLRELEQAGLVKREEKARGSEKKAVFYSLTSRGERLFVALAPLIEWAERAQRAMKKNQDERKQARARAR